MHNSRLLGASTHRCDERLLERTSIALALRPRTLRPSMASAAADLGRLNRLAGGRADERRSSDPPFVGVSAPPAANDLRLRGPGPSLRRDAPAVDMDRRVVRGAAAWPRSGRGRRRPRWADGAGLG